MNFSAQDIMPGLLRGRASGALCVAQGAVVNKQLKEIFLATQSLAEFAAILAEARYKSEHEAPF